MTNIDRAAEIIAQEWATFSSKDLCGHEIGIARALANAGLLSPADAHAATVLNTYYRLECRTPSGEWIAYHSHTTEQGWTTSLRYAEDQLEDGMDTDRYRIVSQVRGPITACTSQKADQ